MALKGTDGSVPTYHTTDIGHPTLLSRPDIAQFAPANCADQATLLPLGIPGMPLLAGSASRDGIHVDIQWHFHDMHKLLYAFEGATEVESRHGRNLVPRQLAAWIPAGVPHCTSIHGIRWVSVFLPPTLLQDRGQRVRTLMVSPLMREMMQESLRWPVGAPESALGRDFFRAMAGLCAEWMTREARLFLPTSRDPRVKRALDYTNLHMDSNLAEVCRHTAMSVRSLRRHLKAGIGMTWEEYRLRSRLLQAGSLLSESSAPVSDIAARCGFESPSGFAKAFRAEMGESPRQYRLHRIKPGR